MQKPSEPSLSGAMVLKHLEVMRERYGPALSEARCDLSPDAQEELAAALPVAWIRLETWEALYAALAKRLGKKVADVHWEVGRESVERTFKTLWRVLLRFTSDEALVARTPLFHSKSFNRGKLTSRVVSPGRGEIELTEWPSTPDYVRRGMAIGISTVLTLAGRSDVKVEDERRRDGVFYRVRWTP